MLELSKPRNRDRVIGRGTVLCEMTDNGKGAGGRSGVAASGRAKIRK